MATICFVEWLWFLKTSSARTETPETGRGTNAVDFESRKRRRVAVFLSRSAQRQRDASLRDGTEWTADRFFDCLGWAELG